VSGCVSATVSLQTDDDAENLVEVPPSWVERLTVSPAGKCEINRITKLSFIIPLISR